MRADLWQQLPSLVEARAEASAVVLGESLYVFGGMTLTNQTEFVPLRTIERLNLKGSLSQRDAFAFTTIDLKFPFAVANIGILPVSQTEVLLIGGFAENGEVSDKKLRFTVVPCQSLS